MIDANFTFVSDDLVKAVFKIQSQFIGLADNLGKQSELYIGTLCQSEHCMLKLVAHLHSPSAVFT